MDKQKVIFKDLGIIEYKTAWDYQEELLQQNVKIKSAIRNGQFAVGNEQWAMGNEQSAIGNKPQTTNLQQQTTNHKPFTSLSASTSIYIGKKR